MVEKSRALKEILFNSQTVATLSEAIRGADPEFDSPTFQARVFDQEWPGRELKSRMRHITTVLHDLLPADYPKALNILRQAAPRLPHGSFIAMVPADFVEVYGVDDFEMSIAALELFTQQTSAEFAVRPFIIRYPEKMMAQMSAWASHGSADVRRLATEGCRPRLPWGVALPALKRDPSPIIPILNLLQHDPSETVRRSVANNLNDIAKDNPGIVIETLRRWRLEGESPELRAITRQALRTLIKAGNADALELLGVGARPLVTVHRLSVNPTHIPLGGEIAFSFEIESLSEAPQDLVIDYVIHLARSGGKTSPKVFKLARRTLRPGETIRITRKHSFRPITTRKYYPGKHALQLKINGQLFDGVEFTLGA